MTAFETDDDTATRPSGWTVTTAAGRTTIDLTTLSADAPSTRGTGEPGGYIAHSTDARSREFDDPGAHLLRLCLDLQLDALLLTIGAAAAQQVRDDVSSGWTPSGSLPWLRWVEEDVDLAATLAADALAGRATLPSTLGTEVDHRVPATVVDNLVARYESMRDLLLDLLDRDTSAGADGRRPQIREALHRCQSRLVELGQYGLSRTPPRGLRLDTPAASTTGSPLAPEHRYLPGELLG